MFHKYTTPSYNFLTHTVQMKLAKMINAMHEKAYFLTHTVQMKLRNSKKKNKNNRHFLTHTVQMKLYVDNYNDDDTKTS
jgi:O-acetyl-ADP-ribose deacetylase (regulator of RNase III)